MPSPARRPRLPAAFAVIALCAALAAPAAAQATTRASERPCALAVRDQDPPGRTPAYDLSVAARRTSCARATMVMRAFHRCRTASGVGCSRTLLGGWRCRGRRDRGTPTFRGTFACSSRGRSVRGAYRQDMPACFGAAARDPRLACVNPTRSIFPAPGNSDPDLTWLCSETVADGCVIGVPEAQARGHFALIGDSHTVHWRPALNVLAQVLGWRGLAISTGGCFFSEVVGSFDPNCMSWYRDAQTIVARHPEITTVFVTQNADTPVEAPPGQTSLDFKVAGFQRAWQALPATVEHVVVLRDTTITTQETFDCIVRVVEAGTQPVSRACPLSRSVALREDAAAVAARRMRSPRYDVIDLSRHLCGSRACHPVVGGVLVNGDIYGHLNPTFMRTLGPYLLRSLRRLRASW